MADDIKVKLGIDAGQLFADLDKVKSKLGEVGRTADKADADLKQIDDQKIDIDTAPAKQALETLGKDAEGIGSKLKESFSGANLGAGLVGGLAGGLASAGIGAAVQGVQALGKAIFDGAVRADEFGDKLEVAFKQQGVKDIAGEIDKVRASSLALANDLGLPVERTRELAGTVAQLGGVTGAQAEGLTKLSAGIETFTDGTVKGEAVAKAFSRGLADPEGAAAIEALSKKYPQLAETLKSNLNPTEKLAAANKILQTSFETVAAQQSDAGGTFNKLSNAVSEAFEKIGGALNDILNTIIPIFTETLGPIFEKLSNTTSEYIERIWSVAGPILALIGGAIIQGIVISINNALVVLDIFYSIGIKIFDAVKDAIMPLYDTIKGLFGSGGEMEKGVDVIELFKEYLGNVTEVFTMLGTVIADFGGLLVEYLITPFQVVVSLIGDIVRSIAGWMGANDQNTESIKASSEAAGLGVSPMMKLRTAFDNIRGTIGGVKEAFIAIKSTIADFFDALTKFDLNAALNAFAGFGDKISKAYDKGFNETRDAIQKTQQAQQELTQITETEEQKRARLLAEKKKKQKEDDKNKPKGSAPKVETELEKSLEAYNAYYLELEVKRNEYNLTLKGSEEEQKKLTEQRLKDDAVLQQEYLNKVFAKATGTDYQAKLTITANEKEGESADKVIKTYQDIFAKNKATLDKASSIKPTIDKDAIKEIEDYYKSISDMIKEQTKGNAKLIEEIVPSIGAINDAELQKAIEGISKFRDVIGGQIQALRDQLAAAQIAGADKAAEALQAQITEQEKNLDTLRLKEENYADKSKKTIKENTLEYQVQNALQTSFLDVFNSDKIRKEKETNEAIKKERLDSLNAEEKDLNKSLAKREISAEEYAAKLADINKGREDAESKTNNNALKNLKKVGEQTAASVLKSQGDIFKKNAEKMEGNEKVFNEFVGNTLNQFSVLAASGTATLADFGAAAAGAAFDAVAAMIPSFVTGILGTSIISMGPILGPLAAAGLTATLYGLLGLARSAAGFKDGVVGLHGEGTETSDSIPAWLSRGESVITARATSNNRDELEFMNNTGLSIAEFYKMKMPSTSVSVTPDGDLIREVRKLREETRGLGVRIQRNTSVEVSGVLTADSNSINAMIVQQKRRSARRG